MSYSAPTKPVEDSISKVNDEIAVGDDLEFQSKWWRFERVLWVLFIIIVICDLAGLFGRGYLAQAKARSSDGKMELEYERVERFRTPSILTVHLGPGSIRDRQLRLWVDQSLVKPLGNQRIIPQPSESLLDGRGIIYTFPVTSTLSSIQFALEPGAPGLYKIAMRVMGSPDLVERHIIVVP
jgi:hypothetical protein